MTHPFPLDVLVNPLADGMGRVAKETRFVKEQHVRSAERLEAAARACQWALAWRPAGLATDLDGTISPIAPRPSDAAVGTDCREALFRLVASLDLVAVLSGRPAEEAHDIVAVEGIEYLGAHGLERWRSGHRETHPDGDRYLAAASQALDALRLSLRAPGVLVEHKGPVVAVHYRQTEDPRHMRKTLLESIGPLASEMGLRVVEGRRVIELRPPVHVDKGTAVLDLARDHGLRSLVYLGDDATDLDAFVAIRRWRDAAPDRRGVAVGVASSEMPEALITAADYLLGGVPEVERLLQRLAVETGRPSPSS